MKVVFYARGPLVEFFRGVGDRLESSGFEVRYLCDDEPRPTDSRWRSVTSGEGGYLESFHDLCKEFPKDNLWRALFLERHACFYPSFLGKQAPDWEKWQHYAVRVANNLDRALREERPEYLFSEIAVGTSNYLAYLYCQKHGCRCISMFSSRIGEEIIFCPSLDDEYPQGLREAFESFMRDGNDESLAHADRYIQKMRNRPESPVYMLTNAEAFHLIKRRKLETLLSILRRGRDDTWVLNRLSASELLRYNLLRWRNNRQLARYSWDEVPENYFYYPLQYEPEAATLLMGNDYSNQLSIIERIARNLPGGCLLVVKEHYAQPGSRDWSFYGKLRYFPNVRLVRPGTSSIDLIRGCRAVVTVNSTVGWEALLLKKPVYLLGRAVYRLFPYVVSLEKEPYWFEAFRGVDACAERMLEERYDCTLRSFVAAYLQKCYPGNFIPGSPGFLAPANMDIVAESIRHFTR